MPKLSYMSPEQYITLKTLQYPSLYAAQSFASAKLAIMDHLLSTLGNDISFEDFLSEILLNKKNKETLEQPSDYLFDGTKMFYINKLSKDDSYAREKPIHPNTGKEVFVLTMEQLKEFGWDNPEEYKWFENKQKNDDKWVPYPYFEKTYNMLWNHENELGKIPVSFLHEFVTYYRTVLDVFTTDKQYFYHYACPAPSDTEKWTEELEQWQTIYEKNTAEIQDEEEKMKKFSEDYCVPYNGDMRTFLEQRHKQEIDKCIQFVNETIQMLENTIALIK